MSEARIIELDKRGSYRYIRDNFTLAGQRSFDTPPAEDQDMLHVMENVMPSLQGGLNRRWGITPFGSATASRLAVYQNDATESRKLLGLSTDVISALNEDGTSFRASVLSPGTGAEIPRTVSSRDYLYITDGVAADLVKWNGSATDAPTKWGVTAPASAVTLGQAATSSTALRPTTFKNGWGANEYPGYYEMGVDQSREWGLNADTTYAYDNPDSAVDSDESTKASATPQHTHKYYGCIWKFAYSGNPIISMKLRVLSQVPSNGTDGLLVNYRSASMWYSTDAGVSWTMIYDSATRAKQWDTVDIPIGIDPNDIWVMAFTDSHDDMCHYVFDINLALITGTVADGGLTLPLGGRRYYQIFKTVTGHYSDLSPMSVITGQLTGQEQPLTDLAVSSDPQVSHVTLLSTADGGDPSTLYWLADITNGTTTYTDTTPEEILLSNNVFLETDSQGIEHGCADNTPPVNGSLPIKHRGRLYMAYQGQYLRFSKSLNEVTTSTGQICGRYEECWPADYEMDISEGAETIRGLFSDGQTLYIGTERHIRKLYGDGPENFEKSEMAFNEVGLANQDVCKVVFQEGTPAGVIWLTPDRRVIGSDFNVYSDIGNPIQDVLNTINLNALETAHAEYYSQQGYSLYLLAIPTGSNTTCDTICVYSLSTKRWMTWKLAAATKGMLFNVTAQGIPQLIFALDA